MLTYVILLLLGVVEILLAMLLVKAVARIRWGWLRWSAGLLLAAFAAYASLGVVVTTMGGGRLDEESRFWFRGDFPFPTFRLFVLGISMTFPTIVLLCVILGLRRDKNQLAARARLWPLKKVLAWLAGALAIALVVGAANDWMIRREIAAFEQRGRQLAQSAAPAACQEADNAAIPFAEAVALVRAGPERPDGKLDSPVELASQEWRDFLAANRHAADLLRDGARRPACRFEANWGQANILDDLGPASGMGDVAQVLYAESTQQLLDGNAEHAFANVAVLRRVAEHLNSDPRFIVQLVGMSIEFRAMRLLEHALYVRAPTEDEVQACLRPKLEYRSGLPKSLVWNEAEACTALADMYLGRLADEKDQQVPGYTSLLAVQLPFMRLLYARDDLYALPFHFERLQWTAQRSYAELADGDTQQPERFKITEQYQLIGAHAGPVTLRLAPVPAQLWAFARTDGERRIADLALTIGRDHRLPAIVEHGPDEAIPPAERPLDPQDAKPLRMVMADGGVVIYSVGGDRKDDGGREMGNALEGDETFCLGEAFRVRRLEKQPEAR